MKSNIINIRNMFLAALLPLFLTTHGSCASQTPTTPIYTRLKQHNTAQQLFNDELKRKIRIELIGKSTLKEEHEIYFTLKITNLTVSKITAIKGILYFNDLFNDPVLKSIIKIFEEINPGQDVEWAGTIGISKDDDATEILARREMSELIFDYSINAIIYKDGKVDEFPPFKYEVTE